MVELDRFVSFLFVLSMLVFAFSLMQTCFTQDGHAFILVGFMTHNDVKHVSKNHGVVHAIGKFSVESAHE